MKTETADLSFKEKLSRYLQKVSIPRLLGRIFVYVLLIDLAFVFLYPFIYMIVTMIKSPDDLLDITIEWIPSGIYWNNFKIAYNALMYIDGVVNSLIITVLCIIGHLISCSFIAYGFARYRFPGRNQLFALVLLSLVVPVQTLIFPQFIMYSRIGWTGTFAPIIVPTFIGWGLRGGLFIFIFRQFFLGLPSELEDAAKVDGCNAFSTYWSIVRPIAGSSTLVSGILAMVWHWNDTFEPGLYLNSTTGKSPIRAAIASLLKVFGVKMSKSLTLLPANLADIKNHANAQSMGDVANIEELKVEGELVFNEATVMAGTFMVILPILIAYLVLQRRFMEGIERTGIVG